MDEYVTYGTKYVTLPNTLGPELISNTTFDTATGWTLLGAWTISGGKANWGGVGTTRMYTNCATVPGQIYRVDFDVSTISGTNYMLLANVIGNSAIFSNYGYTALTNGHNTWNNCIGLNNQGITAVWSSNIYGSFSLDNFSIKRVSNPYVKMP